MLKVEELHVEYGAVVALRGVSLHVSEGEMVGVIGPNGAGKTSMLMAIAGGVPAARGSILLEGRSVFGEAPERIVRRGISLVPEGRRILGTLTVEENLRLSMTVRKDRIAARKDLDTILERFPILGTYFRSPAGRLSGGEQQQLAIARALLSRPRLLMMDEPSLGLAPMVVDLVFDVLDELRREGVTILLVEQKAARTIESADRVYILRTGKIELEGTREDFASSAELQNAYFGLT